MNVAELDPAQIARPVAVITGGWSRERDRSLLSGKEVSDTLLRLGFELRVIDWDGGIAALVERLDAAGTAFLAIAGRGAEDGQLQGVLETLGIPYTGSGVLTSALGMNKLAAKTVVAAAGVRVADGRRIDPESKAQTEAVRLTAQLGLPLIVKPVAEGGSIGLRLVHSPDELEEAVLDRADGELMAEVYHAGRSVSVGVLADPETGAVQVLPPLEAETADGVYSYDAKRGGAACAYYCPAVVQPDILAPLTAQAVTAHQALGCRSYSRHDFVVTDSGRAFWLEVNTLPGLTRGGNLARMARAAGLTYEQLLAHILRGARTDRRARA